MKKILLFSLALSLFSIGCTNREKAENPADLKQEVMDIHDEAMAKMEDIHHLSDQLQKMAQIESNAAKKDTLMEAADQLEEADEAMMEWMRNYEDAPEDWTDKEKLDYYLDQKQKMVKVQEQMNESIEKAKQLTNE